MENINIYIDCIYFYIMICVFVFVWHLNGVERGAGVETTCRRGVRRDGGVGVGWRQRRRSLYVRERQTRPALLAYTFIQLSVRLCCCHYSLRWQIRGETKLSPNSASVLGHFTSFYPFLSYNLCYSYRSWVFCIFHLSWQSFKSLDS